MNTRVNVHAQNALRFMMLVQCLAYIFSTAMWAGQEVLLLVPFMTETEKALGILLMGNS